jgi:hypothetical protein
MITVTNRQRYVGIPFEDYLRLPGYSFSFLNKEMYGVAPEVIETAAMRRGTLVDGILTQPDQVNIHDEQYNEARMIAYHITKTLPMNLYPQISYTANFTFNGITLPVRGRLDFELPNEVVLDLKVTNQKNLDNTIRYMNYESQLTGYALMNGAKSGYIAAYVVPLKVVSLRRMDLNAGMDFWKRKIMKYGE